MELEILKKLEEESRRLRIELDDMPYRSRWEILHMKERRSYANGFNAAIEMVKGIIEENVDVMAVDLQEVCPVPSFPQLRYTSTEGGNER